MENPKNKQSLPVSSTRPYKKLIEMVTSRPKFSSKYSTFRTDREKERARQEEEEGGGGEEKGRDREGRGEKGLGFVWHQCKKMWQKNIDK